MKQEELEEKNQEVNMPMEDTTTSEEDIRVEEISLNEQQAADEEEEYEEEETSPVRKIIGIVGTVVAVLCVAAAIFMVIRYMNAVEANNQTEPETTISAAAHLQAAKDFEAAGEYGKAISAYQWYLKTETADIDLLLCMREDYKQLNMSDEVSNCNNQILELSKTATLTETQKTEVLSLYYTIADRYSSTDKLRAYIYLTEEVPIEGAYDNYTYKDVITPVAHPLAADGVQQDGTVFFGTYPSKEVTGADLSEYITNGEFNENNIFELYGTYYYREMIEDTYHYFILENLQWNVLSSENNTYFLQTTQIVDANAFHEELVEVTWDNSTLRTYLNETFLNRAFTEQESSYVLTMTDEPCGNPTYNLQKEGATVQDRVSVLSVAQLYSRYNKDFHTYMKEHHAEYRAIATDYAAAKGILPDADGYGKWWVRTMGVDSTRKMAVGQTGEFSTDGFDVNYTGAGIRAAILISGDAF